MTSDATSNVSTRACSNGPWPVSRWRPGRSERDSGRAPDSDVGGTGEEFARTRLFDDTRLHLFYGASGELAAFLNFTADPIVAGGPRVLVVSCALVSRLDYQASTELASAAVRETVRVRLTFRLGGQG